MADDVWRQTRVHAPGDMVVQSVIKLSVHLNVRTMESVFIREFVGARKDLAVHCVKTVSIF